MVFMCPPPPIIELATGLLYAMIECNGMIFKMGIKLFLVFSIHVFQTLIGFTDNYMHVNVFLIRLQMLDL